MPTNKTIKKPAMSEARIRRQIKKYKITLKKVTKKVLTKKQKHKTVKKVSKKIEIKPDMIISKVIEKYPEAIKVFFNYGITCVGCFLASSETIEQGISAHGINIKKFLEDLNREVNK